MRNAGLEEAQAGIKIAGRNINNLRYADDTTLMAESEEELKGLLMKVKVESEKIGFKLNIQKTGPLLCLLRAVDPLHLHQWDGSRAAGLEWGGVAVRGVALGGAPRLQRAVHQGHRVPEGRGHRVVLGLG